MLLPAWPKYFLICASAFFCTGATPPATAQESEEQKPTVIVLELVAEEVKNPTDDDDDKKEKEGAEKKKDAKKEKQKRKPKEVKPERNRVAPEELQQMERKHRELAERLEQTQRKLEERSRENEKLRAALVEREKAVVVLKKELAARMESAKVGARPVDKILATRVERLEEEITKLSGSGSRPIKPTKPEMKETEKIDPKTLPEAKDADGGTLILGGTTVLQRSTSGKVTRLEGEAKKAALAAIGLPAQANDIPPPTPKVEESVIRPPMPALPLKTETPTVVPNAGEGIAGVGIVEGDVVALLPQEGKIVIKVSSWNDGKQLRADWVGQQVSIVQGALPAVKVGDHISLDARIDAQKGFVWGGKVFNGAVAK